MLGTPLTIAVVDNRWKVPKIQDVKLTHHKQCRWILTILIYSPAI